MKRYDCYNDYELLYLIKDGNEKAFNYFFQKYDCLIIKIAIDLYPQGDKQDDLVQEGRMILYDCIKNYDSSYGTPFFSYFLVSLKRKYYKLIQDDYYGSLLSLDDLNIPEIINHNKNGVAEWLKKILKNTIYYDLYISVFFCDMSIRQYAYENNLTYNSCYTKYLKMIEFIKKTLT